MTKEMNLTKKQTQSVATRRNLQKLKLDLSDIKKRTNANWWSPRYGPEEEIRPDFGEGNYLVFKCTDDDNGARSLIQCHLCDFEINTSLVRTRLDAVHYYVPKIMFCPVCDGKIGEDNIKITQKSSPQQRTFKSEKTPTSGIHPSEGSSNNALDISKAKGFGIDALPDVGDEQKY